MINSIHQGNDKIRGEWWVLAAAILWGTTGTAQAFGPQSSQPATVGALRLLLGGIALLVFALMRRSFHPRNSWPIQWTVLAAGCIAAYQLLFFASVRLTGVATGTLVAIGSAPILTGFLARVFQREYLSRRWIISTALAIFGCSLLMVSTNQDGGYHYLGVVLALGAGFSYTGYSISTKQILEDQKPEAVIAVVFTLGALILSPLLLIYNLEWFTKPGGFIVILHLGLIATALAYLMFARGLKRIPVSSAVSLTLAEPLTAAFLGIVVLQEELSWSILAGMVLLLVGLTILVVQNPYRFRGSPKTTTLR